MSAYNSARFIEEAIESVLSQEGPTFELLIGDDASTDSTREKIRRFRSHRLVTPIYGRKRNGQGKMRNDLAKLSRSTYLCPVDSDDVLLPGALSRLASYLDRHRSIGLVYADCLMIWEQSRQLPLLCGRSPQHQWDLLGSPINHGGALLRRESFWKCGGYDERRWSIEDFSMLLRFQEKFRVHYLKGELTYLWRRHGQSTTHRRSQGEAMLRLVAEAHERRKRINL